MGCLGEIVLPVLLTQLLARDGAGVFMRGALAMAVCMAVLCAAADAVGRRWTVMGGASAGERRGLVNGQQLRGRGAPPGGVRGGGLWLQQGPAKRRQHWQLCRVCAGGAVLVVALATALCQGARDGAHLLSTRHGGGSSSSSSSSHSKQDPLQEHSKILAGSADTPPRQTALQARKMAQWRARAEALSDAAADDLLASLDRPSVRRALAGCCPGVAALPAAQLLQRLVEELEAAELVHNFNVQADVMLSDTTLRWQMENATGYFSGVWEYVYETGGFNHDPLVKIVEEVRGGETGRLRG